MGATLEKTLVGLLLLPGLAQGKGTGSDRCMDHCYLEKGEAGYDVLCPCGERRFPHDGEGFFALKNRAPGRYATELAARLHGASAGEVALVDGDRCLDAVGESRANPRPAKDFLGIVTLAQRPLCECVQARVHFRTSRRCETSVAGQLECRFELAPGEGGRAGPVRRPALQDYQACIAARLNYRAPASCEGSVCREGPRDCPTGKELVNVADAESCCPIFECRTKEGS